MCGIEDEVEIILLCKFLSDVVFNASLACVDNDREFLSIKGEDDAGFWIKDEESPENEKDILVTMGILLNGEYRENTLTRGIFDYVEKYTRTQGSAKEGLYCYNFCLNTSPFEYQPSGAINMSKFKTILFCIFIQNLYKYLQKIKQ